METTTTSPRERDEDGLFSCWGHLKLRLPWRKKRIGSSGANITSTRHTFISSFCGARNFGCNILSKKPKPGGGFKYDPLSYAQNFDDGPNWDEDYEYGSYRGFSSRFSGVPASGSLPLEGAK